MNTSEHNKETSPRLGLAARIVGTVLVSIIIPLATSFVHDKKGNPLLTTTEQFAVGCFVFIAITVTAISFDLGESLRLRQAEHKVWQIRNQADEWLHNIRSSYMTLLHDSGGFEQNLFAQYFMRIFSAVADDINEAAAKHELRVDELTFGTTDLLIKIMAHRGNQILRLVHALDARPNNFDFTTWSRSYYSELTRLAHDKKIKEIRRLFIYGDEGDLQDDFAQYLLAFHASNTGYDFRALRREDWSNLVRGLGLHESDCEIGIWGELLAYTAIRSSSAGMQGAYTCLPRQIRRLEELFDAGWRLAERPYTKITDRVTVADLFKWSGTLNGSDVVGPVTATAVGLTGEGPHDPVSAIPPTSGLTPLT